MNDGGSDHVVDGREYNSCASVEGFAHYFAAASWNNLGDNADGIWMDWAASSEPMAAYSRWDIEVGSKKIHDHCGPGSGCCGYGTEIDWARTFWDFRTDSGSPKPDNVDVLDVWEHAFEYEINALSCSAGHYADIKHAVSWILGPTLEARFNGDAVYNGANY